jgi:hypothetical protein
MYAEDITGRLYGQRTIQSAAAELWNRLPKNIKNADTVSSFKKILKSHFFKGLLG